MVRYRIGSVLMSYRREINFRRPEWRAPMSLTLGDCGGIIYDL